MKLMELLILPVVVILGTFALVIAFILGLSGRSLEDAKRRWPR